MKCDLHVHSVHSGMCTTPLLSRVCRESYNDPAEVYARLRKKGMDLITLTDHDSIGAAESLRCHPEFFTSEEVTCRMPSGTLVHIGVYDITDRQHIEIQRRRDDLLCLLAYLTERRLLFGVNHVFSSLTGRRDIEDFAFFRGYFPAVETRSGHMLPFHNREAERFARRLGKAGVGGSDSHAILSVGSTYTEVPGARDKTEFLQGIRAGKAITWGENGSYLKLTRDVLWIVGKMVQENPWKVFLTPLVALLPVATLATMVEEMVFARRWSARLEKEALTPPYRLGNASISRSIPLAEEVLAWQ
jgi:predicted metal-dependent phosphoesterase TrpH